MQKTSTKTKTLSKVTTGVVLAAASLIAAGFILGAFQGDNKIEFSNQATIKKENNSESILADGGGEMTRKKCCAVGSGFRVDTKRCAGGCGSQFKVEEGQWYQQVQLMDESWTDWKKCGKPLD